MTDNKKSAEGPFILKSREDGMLVCKFKPTGSIAMFHYPALLSKQVNSFLARWLKSPSGKRWMEENGVGGKK